jgi:hypothetical protein
MRFHRHVTPTPQHDWYETLLLKDPEAVTDIMNVIPKVSSSLVAFPSIDILGAHRLHIDCFRPEPTGTQCTAVQNIPTALTAKITLLTEADACAFAIEAARTTSENFQHIDPVISAIHQMATRYSDE